MSRVQDAKDIEDELDVVWLEDLDRFDYVRELFTQLPFRARPPRHGTGGGRVVGYTTLRPGAPGGDGYFLRRVFWVAPHDRSEDGRCYSTSGAPSEAVDPRTVAPGVPGRITDRAWGRTDA